MPRFCPGGARNPEEGQLLKQRILRECDKSNARGGARYPWSRRGSKFSLRVVRELSQKRKYLHWTLKDEQALSRQRRWEGYSRQREAHGNSKKAWPWGTRGRVLWLEQRAQGAQLRSGPRGVVAQGSARSSG